MNIIKTLTTTAVMVSLMMNVSTVANATPSVATAQEITAAGTALSKATWTQLNALLPVVQARVETILKGTATGAICQGKTPAECVTACSTNYPLYSSSTGAPTAAEMQEALLIALNDNILSGIPLQNLNTCCKAANGGTACSTPAVSTQ